MNSRVLKSIWQRFKFWHHFKTNNVSCFHHLYYKAPLVSFTSCSWSSPSCVCRRSSQASYWALYHWRPSQHSASHLSDRCLLPKQWVIAVLHLSGCTHLVWSAAFSLLFLVMAWHPQSAYPASFFFFGHGTQMLCLCLALSVCVCLFHRSACFCIFHLFASSPLVFLPSLTRTPQSKELGDYVGEKAKGCFATRGIKERSNLSLPVLASWLNIDPLGGAVFFTFPFQDAYILFLWGS